MSRNHEGAGTIASLGTIFLLSFIIGNAVGRAVDNGDERVRQVQEYNHELYDQLAASRAVGHLILNDKEHTFSFQNEADGNCAGKYEVHHNLAAVVGPLACTHTLPLPQPS
jgi:hypothetical protein